MIAALLSFVAGLVTLGITLTLILTSVVMLITMKKGGGKVGMTQTRKIIVASAVFLVLLAGLFPPYWVGKVDEEGRLVGKMTRWEFNRQFKDLLESVIEKRPLEMITDMRRDDLIIIEISMILILAGAAYVFLGNKGRRGELRTKGEVSDASGMGRRL